MTTASANIELTARDVPQHRPLLSKQGTYLATDRQ